MVDLEQLQADCKKVLAFLEAGEFEDRCECKDDEAYYKRLCEWDKCGKETDIPVKPIIRETVYDISIRIPTALKGRNVFLHYTDNE